MFLYSIWLSLAVSGVALATPPIEFDRAQRIETVTFHSRTLGCDKTFCVVLPRGYDRSGAPWPVLFLFHGRGRNELSLIDDQRSRDLLLAAPLVIVLPDGDDGWYIDSPVRADDRYETYIEEVVEVADSHFNLSQRRECRGLSGWSMGGYGCTLFAETHADQFAAVAPIIGLLDFPRRGLPIGQSYEVPIDRFGSDANVWQRFNPMTHAERLKAMSVLIVTADEAFDRTMNENFAARLKQLGIRHQWRSLKGKHTFDTVRQALPVVIDFMNQALSRASKVRDPADKTLDDARAAVTAAIPKAAEDPTRPIYHFRPPEQWMKVLSLDVWQMKSIWKQPTL